MSLAQERFNNMTFFKSKSKFFSTLFLLLFLVLCAKANTISNTFGFETIDQQYSVKGMIMDQSGQPLPGASIVEKGTNNGAQSDFEGNFVLSVASKESVLIFSFIGYVTKEIVVKDQDTLSVILDEDFQRLDEVVLVGFGSVKKSDLTGSVSSVKPEDLNIGNVSNVSQMLQGRVSGLYVNSHNQDPGANPEFLLRGASSFLEGDAGQPLVVIDGFPMQNTSSLNSVNPNDIAQIDILKDASATAIYGSRGANGVIIVTTKTGNNEGIQINYDAKTSTQFVARSVDMLNASQYARFYLDLAYDPNLQIPGFGPGNEPHSFLEIKNITVNTDWQKEIINNNNFAQEHNLAISGVSSGVKYRVSGNYLKGDAAVGPASYKRFIGLGKMSFERPKFSFNTVFNFTNENRNNLRNSYWDALIFSPTSPIFDDSGELSAHASPNLFYQNNPLFNETALEDITETNNIRVNAGVSYEFIDGLRIELNGGITQTNDENFTQRIKPTYSSQTATAGSLLATSSRNIYADYFLKYIKSLNRHNFVIMAGGSYNSYRRRSLGASAENFPYPNISYYNINAGLDMRQMNSNWVENKTVSGLVRLNYDYDKKLLLTSSIRLDAASQFGKGNKEGYFPSVSIAYRIDKEDFFENIGFLETLKVRAGYGSAGNANIPAFRTQRLINFIPTFNGGSVSNAIQWEGNSKPNPNLHWEETNTLNLGLEFGNNKFYSQIDFYNKKSSDLLLNRQTPIQSGFQNITLNIGEMKNTGVEAKLDLFLDFYDKKLKWRPGFWFSYNKNEVVDLNNDKLLWNETWLSNTSYGSTGIRQEGYPLQGQWGYDFIGIWQKNEAAEAAVFNAVPGDPKFLDIDDNKKIDKNDIKYLGNSDPSYTGGFSSNLSYKNFEFSFFIEGVFDKFVLNNNKISLTHPSFIFGRNLTTQALDRWTVDHPSNNTPSLTKNPSEQLVRSDWALEDASFVRLRDVTFSYRFDFNNQRAFKNLKLYMSASNLITITKYSGLNPDVYARDDQYNLRPYTSTLTFGLNASF